MLRQAIGAPALGSRATKTGERLGNSRQLLGEPAAIEMLEEGRRMSIEQAAAYAAASQ